MTSPVNYVEPFWGSGATWFCHPLWGDEQCFPVPYFGGKRRAAGLIWERFGCSELPKVATANDMNGFVANAMRAMAADPNGVAEWCDWPVSEVDLHARHRWLLAEMKTLRARLEECPTCYDARIAGWWIWGASQWTGSGWCEEGTKPSAKIPRVGAKSEVGSHAKGMRGPSRRLPDLAGSTQWGTDEPNTRAGKGIHGATMRGPSRQLPNLAGSSARGETFVNHGCGINGAQIRTRLHDVFSELQRRLRPIMRFACGDFERVLTPSVTWRHGPTAVLLDPVYKGFADVYGGIGKDTAERAEKWARENGERSDLRIALCGYEGDYDLPGWEVVAWKAKGGYANQGDGSNENAKKERIWFSPHCLRPGVHFGQRSLFK